MVVAAFNSFFNSLKATKIFSPKLCDPSVVAFVKRDTLVSAGVVCSDLFVKVVLGVRDYPHVLAAAVKAVAVDMVNKQTFGGVHNEPVQHDVMPFCRKVGRSKVKLSLCVKRIPTFSGIPFPLVKNFVVGIVNNNLFALGELYGFHGVTIACR